MAIITLTTDHGLKDFYVSAIKGAILSQLPQANIVDITHQVPRFDIAQAAFILRNAYKEFPAGTIHIVGVRPDLNTDTPHIAVYCHQQYFIGADNGIFSLVFDLKPEKIVELEIKHEGGFMRPTKGVFVQAACHIARGGTLEVLGKPIEKIKERALFRAVVEKSTIRGTVIYIDSYGNVITNIDEQLFKEVARGREFTISFRVPGYDIKEISTGYTDVTQSEKLALFGATGFLEIAINMGNASELLGLDLNSIVRVDFHDR